MPFCIVSLEHTRIKIVRLQHILRVSRTFPIHNFWKVDPLFFFIFIFSPTFFSTRLYWTDSCWRVNMSTTGSYHNDIVYDGWDLRDRKANTPPFQPSPCHFRLCWRRGRAFQCSSYYVGQVVSESVIM